MALVRRDEVLEKALSTDETAIPRFNIYGEDGGVIHRNARLELANKVVTPGTPINKVALDEILAASGVTGGTSTAYTLAQEDYALKDGAEVRFRLHAATRSGATLNVNGTGAKPLRDAMGNGVANGIPAGTWLSAMYSAATDAYSISGGGGASSNPNLLDNWYFADPINQRGLTEYSGTGWNATYSTNRWYLSVANYDVSNRKLKTINAYGRMVQRIDVTNLIGKTVTFSILVRSVSGGRLSIMHGPGDYGAVYAEEGFDGIISSTVTIADPGGRASTVSIILNAAGASAVIEAAKLELGSTQTLAHQDATGAWVLNDPPPDKGMELLKCIQSTADPADTYANKTITTNDQAKLIAAAQSKVISTAHITTAAKQIDIPVPSGYTRYRMIAAGLSVDYSQEDSLEPAVFNLHLKATAQTASSRAYKWYIGGYNDVSTFPRIDDLTNGQIGSVPASRSANSAYMQMEIFKNGSDWAGTLNGNGSSWEGEGEFASGFCYATFTSTEISTLSLVCSANITAGMILLEGLA